MNESCESCKYFGNAGSKLKKDADNSDVIGECLRFAPKADLKDHDGYWPKVFACEWYGQWSPIPTDKSKTIKPVDPYYDEQY